MKLVKFLSLAASLVFAFIIIIVSLLQEHVSCDKSSAESYRLFGEAQAQEATTEASVVSQEATNSAANIVYYLPYPGILPDHPLYWLKMIRDRIALQFTQNSQDRYQKLLTYADKRLGASQALVEGRKFSLGVSTATKGEKYLDQAVSQFQQLDKEGKTTAIMKDQIKKAVLKHQQVLEELIEETEENKDILEASLQNTNNLLKVLNKN